MVNSRSEASQLIALRGRASSKTFLRAIDQDQCELLAEALQWHCTEQRFLHAGWITESRLACTS